MTSVIFAGRTISLPGVYTTIKSAINNTPNAQSYSKLLMIDTGQFGSTFGAGGGINGVLQNGKNAIQAVDNIQDFQAMVKGGLAWLLGQPLFFPDGYSSKGVSEIQYVRACTTAPATINFSFGNANIGEHDSSTDGGTVAVQVRDEGVVGNGILISGNLSKGYAAQMRVGVNDSTKYILDFYIGTFKGLDADGDPYDGIAAINAIPTLIVSSAEFKSIADLLAWMKSNSTFNAFFNVSASGVLGSGNVEPADVARYSSYLVATGGTESYSSADLDTVLDYITPNDYSFILCDNWGDQAMSSNNGKILAHVVQEAKYEKQVVIGGGKNSLKFTQTNGSIPIAQYYNSDRVVIVHSGVSIPSNINGTGFKNYDSIYHAAAVVGRILGLPPQIPVTFKGLNIAGVAHPLKTKEQKLALSNGVLCTAWDNEVGRFTIVQGVNSLQNNIYLINTDATSFSIQVKRIIAQVNKTLSINGKQKFFNTETGANRFSMSPQVVADWAKSELKALTVTSTDDNLLLSFKNVTTTINQDNIYLNWAGVCNSEITKLLISGTLIDG